VLVTGGAGFIGSHLVRRLLGDGSASRRRRPLHRLAGEPARPAVERSLEVIESDLTDGLAGPLADREPFDEIYHLAAAVGVDWS
jgi:nucleoside-diphosphate-sugar epimerase